MEAARRAGRCPIPPPRPSLLRWQSLPGRGDDGVRDAQRCTSPPLIAAIGLTAGNAGMARVKNVGEGPFRRRVNGPVYLVHGLRGKEAGGAVSPPV
eukprot:scaffold5096_cov116-Isochrysis_galbana.AAC.5